MTEAQSTIQTLDQVLSMMSPFAGGSRPGSDTQEYADWVRWIGQKQEEYARRGFWRRCLTREAITLTPGFTTVLPARFHKPNGLFMLIVDEVDWNEPDNEAEQYIFIEMDNAVTTGTPAVANPNFGKWQMRFENEILVSTSAVIWYFSNPPTPVALTDKLLLPGDMVAYAALQEYYRTTGSEGSEDKAEQLAENRFAEYNALEVLPDKKDLLVHTQGGNRVDRLQKAKDFYRNRPGRNYQN
jgi:hypothetical protein